MQKAKIIVPPGLEPGTFRVLSERDNHYTTGLIGDDVIVDAGIAIHHVNCLVA